LKAKDKLQQLKDSGEIIYSNSKINTFNNCQFEYYNTYVLKNRGIGNCYTEMGSEIHNNIENIYNGVSNKEDLKVNYNNKLAELEILDIRFPNEKIKASWVSDVNHFVENFNKMDTKMKTEELIVFQTDDGEHFQGYIDAIVPSEKGKPYVNIIDWKTSSKFSGKKLNEAGRQLLMYGLGLEQTTNYKVDKIMWFMVKYLYVCNVQKNGKTKRKMCNRGKWVKEIKNPLEKALYKLGIDEFEVDILLDQAIESNNLEGLPQEIQGEYWLQDCFVEYEVTDKKKKELKEYLKNTIIEINSKNKDDESEWKPVEITKYDSFYCATLCGHRKSCKFYKQFLKENVDDFNKVDKSEFGDLFN